MYLSGVTLIATANITVQLVYLLFTSADVTIFYFSTSAVYVQYALLLISGIADSENQCVIKATHKHYT